MFCINEALSAISKTDSLSNSILSSIGVDDSIKSSAV